MSWFLKASLWYANFSPFHFWEFFSQTERERNLSIKTLNVWGLEILRKDTSQNANISSRLLCWTWMAKITQNYSPPLHCPFCPMVLLYTSIWKHNSEVHKTNLTLKVRVVDPFGFLCWMQWFSLGKSPVILTLIKVCSRKFQCLLHICCYQEGRGEKEKPLIDLCLFAFTYSYYPELSQFKSLQPEDAWT